MKTAHRERNNIFLVIIFAVCVLFLIIASLTIKFIGIVRESKYEAGRFTVLLLDNAHEAVYLSVDETEKRASKLVLKNTEGMPSLPVGIDGVVHISSDVESDNSAASLVSEMLIKRNEERIHITFLDLIRMYLAFRTTPSEDIDIVIAEKEEDVPLHRLVELFEDQKVLDEDQTIAIENASDVPGVATKLENVIAAMGGNVISVETSVVSVETSRIVTEGDASYTSKKIRSYLGYPLEVTEDQQVSDISIIIGKDGFGNVIFPEN